MNRYRGSTRPSSRRGITKLLRTLSVTAGTASVSSCAFTSVYFVHPLAGCVWLFVCFIPFWFMETFHRNTLLPDGGGAGNLLMIPLPWNVIAQKKKKSNCSLANTYGWGAETLQIRHHIPDHNDTPVVEWEALLKMIRYMHSEVWLFAAPWTSLPGSTAHGIFQARILEWGAISYSKGSSRPRDQTRVSRISRQRLPLAPPGDFWGSAAAAKSLQSYPALWDRIEGSPTGSPVLACPFKDHTHPTCEKT